MDVENICIYCRKPFTNKTREHVIPKSLFNVENRVNLLTVPCCKECNNSFSQDNEEFKIFLISEEETAQQPTAKDLVEEVERALNRKEKLGFALQFGKSMKTVFVCSPLGIEIKVTYDPDMELLYRVVRRIVHCLYYHKFNAIIPLDYEVRVYEGNSVSRSGEEIGKVINQFEEWLKNVAILSVGNGTFNYKYAPIVDQVHASLWKMVFYNVTTFWATAVKMPEVVK